MSFSIPGSNPGFQMLNLIIYKSFSLENMSTASPLTMRTREFSEGKDPWKHNSLCGTTRYALAKHVLSNIDLREICYIAGIDARTLIPLLPFPHISIIIMSVKNANRLILIWACVIHTHAYVSKSTHI